MVTLLSIKNGLFVGYTPHRYRFSFFNKEKASLKNLSTFFKSVILFCDLSFLTVFFRLGILKVDPFNFWNFSTSSSKETTQVPIGKYSLINIL